VRLHKETNDNYVFTIPKIILMIRACGKVDEYDDIIVGSLKMHLVGMV